MELLILVPIVIIALIREKVKEKKARDYANRYVKRW